ncbi:MAG: metal ABC transporter permease [Firmicutes bacterium]|nr:metal ABC transporter permease [Bacillota bacterium]
MSLANWLLDPLQYAFMQRALAAALLIGVVCAIMGSFLLVKRWALLGDAISHAVLPGVAIAFLLGWPFLVGALLTGVLTALGIGFVERHTRLKQDAVMGLLFVTAFALGLAILSRIRSPVDLFHVLFGNVLAVSPQDLLITAASGLAVVATITALYKELVLWAFDPLMAESVGLPVRGLHYLMLFLVSLTIVASLQAVGIVLVIAMLIAPPATAALLTDRFHRLILIAAGLGAATAVGGLYLSYYLDVASGATMVLVGAGAFAVAMGLSPRRGLLPRVIRRRRAAALAREADYLKQLFSPDPEHVVALQELADRLGEDLLTASVALKHLARLGLVESTPQGFRLTPSGRKRAAQLVRVHRLWERYLVDRAGLGWDQVHAAADRLEHLSPPGLAELLAASQQGPTVDPHGAPIPTREGEMPAADRAYLLSELQVGQEAVVVRVEDEDPKILQSLSALGLVPGRRVRCVAATGEGVTIALHREQEVVVGRHLARAVFVTPVG